ncbi:MAG: DUF2235 domain-containing protein [Candidatus Thiodiazotropha sp. (ex Notomyrtea botanica)]|nr:DUF2235 domain-containing protein [Candidatus Thiodiazotropha sp. (ex Notomyrtea botanica)]
MSKNIVICCDGTGNEIEADSSNVLKLYRLLEKNEKQTVFYDPGIGTISTQNAWFHYTQQIRQVFSLATGAGLDKNVLDAYRFLVEHYRPDDRIFLFGFSRGAYTVRVLAGLIHLMGLLWPHQINLCSYAYKAYKQSSRHNDFKIAWGFRQVTRAQVAPIKYLGVWDTVSSVLVPRADLLVGIHQQTLPYTKTNPSVEVLRQAIAIDEKRRMFRINHWSEPQDYKPNPFNEKENKQQDIKQVWFAGSHADIGGGYSEEKSAPAKFALKWMLREAEPHGLQFNQALFNNIVLGKPRKGSKRTYTAPDVTASLNNSMNPGWRLLEYLPRQVKYNEWPERKRLLGLYLPKCEPRLIPDGALIHHSVTERVAKDTGYRPINLPSEYQTVYDQDETPLDQE